MFENWKRSILFFALAAFVAGIMFAGGCQFFRDFISAPKPSGLQGQAIAEQLPGVGPDAIADVVSSSSPAVVKISTRVTSSRYSDPFFRDPFFRQFFGQSIPEQEEGLGSGFIISPDGYILTNEHVIDGADEINVTVIGHDRELQANIIGADYDLDLALIKIDAGNELPCLKLGNSEQIRVGNWVIAIGNPYGLDHTVTTGVVSAKGRPISVDDRQYENLLQTDASINPGNSGGPLINLNGEVVGINTAINAQAQGIGFAIPTSTVQSVMEDLKNSASTVRPWIGVQVRSVDEEAARYLGLERVSGALVAGVIPGSPAEKAGLKQWDVIMEFNGNEIKTADDLVAAIKAYPTGNDAGMLVVRKHQLLTVMVTISEKPKNMK